MRGIVVHDDALELTPEQEDAIEESIAEIERGECITAEELLADLDAAMQEVERGDFGRSLDDILAEFRASK